METPIQSDPNVLEHIYTRYEYLREHSLNLLGNYIDEATSLGELEGEDFLGFLMAYEVEDERANPERFPFLTPDENRALIRYCHIQPVEPWPQPVIGVAWNEATGEGRVAGTYRVDVVMKDIGNAQVWWGGEVGVLWEAFLEYRIRARSDHELLMHQLWEGLEQFLMGEGVQRIYTLPREPTLDDSWYAAFLAQQDYQAMDGATVRNRTL